jgi:hypothetical protein
MASKQRSIFTSCCAVLMCGVSLFPLQRVAAQSSCVYLDDHGTIVEVRSAAAAPHAFRDRVVCKDKHVEDIAAPRDLKVGADARTASFVTDVGPMHVRWSRSIERCFRSPPSRAVSEAAQALNKALKSGRFASEATYSTRDWSLAFIDRVSAFSQFPLALSSGGHPGFMVPPSRIYLITDFIAPDCEQSVVADDVLAQVLLHEMGHVVEYALLGGREDRFNRERAEGFAVWFEQYSSNFASIIPRDRVRQQYAALVKASRSQNEAGFAGTPSDYARAALPFQAIVNRRGISGLMRVYQVMREDTGSFYQAVERALSWDRKMLDREVRLLEDSL